MLPNAILGRGVPASDFGPREGQGVWSRGVAREKGNVSSTWFLLRLLRIFKTPLVTFTAERHTWLTSRDSEMPEG